MCGHFGVIFGVNETVIMKNKLREYFKQAILTGDLRGGDGVGLMSITNANTYVFKRCMNASEFRQLKEVDSLLTNQKVIALLGHNRKSTFGAKTDTNCHPFNYGTITLFHNGTLEYDKKIQGVYPVDSEYISDKLSKKEDYAGKVKVLESLEGAYSLVWYDVSDDTVNFARNKERPMYMATVGNGSMVYASEKGMIQWLCERNGVEITAITSSEVGKIISISLDPDLKDSTDKIKVFDFKPKESVFVDWYQGYNTRESHSYSNKSRRVVVPAGTKHITTLQKDAEDVCFLPVPKKDKEKEKTYSFCECCGDFSKTLYLVEDTAICKSCAVDFNYNDLALDHASVITNYV
jgi:predicted glutamine amidotransferase